MSEARAARQKANGKARVEATIPPISDEDMFTKADAVIPATSNDDMFTNIEALKVRDLGALPGEVRELVHLPIRKPGRREFVRTHPDPGMMAQVAVFVHRPKGGTDDETFMVRPEILPLVPELQAEMQNVILVLSVNREGAPFWWRIAYGGGSRGWFESALAAAGRAKEKWVRLRGNLTAGEYEVYVALGENLPEPTFPEKSLPDLLRLAFKDRIIDRVDHRVIQQLRCEV